jgi:hypothetical protein
MPITHAFTSAKSDGADATQVRASDWNADHISGLSVTLVRRSTSQTQSSSGAFEPISFDTEDEDTDGCWAIGTPTKIVIPSALNGRRAILFGAAGFDASTLGNYRGLSILLGGSSMTPNAQQLVPDLATGIGVVLQVRTHIVTLATAQEYTLCQRIDDATIGVIAGAAFGLYTVD